MTSVFGMNINFNSAWQKYSEIIGMAQVFQPDNDTPPLVLYKFAARAYGVATF